MGKQLTYATFTNTGGRDVNEDSIGVFTKDNSECFVLCDGLGGHGMGDAASQLVAEVIGSQYQATDDYVNFLGSAFCASQDILLAEQRKRNATRKMKTTACVVVTDEKYAYIGHVGDSRVYVFQHNKVKFRTVDHSVPQMLALSRQIKESEIRFHPDRNILLRVLGEEWDEPKYELETPVPLKKCQAFLLCSDGFWELIDEKEMCELLKKTKSADEWLYEMAVLATSHGEGKNMDNFSAIAVWTGR